jgi:hypothetical protein
LGKNSRFSWFKGNAVHLGTSNHNNFRFLILY